MPSQYCCSIHDSDYCFENSKTSPEVIEHIGQQGKLIFEQFVLYRSLAEGVDLAKAKEFIEKDLASLKGTQSCEIKKVAQALRSIGDELDRNQRLQRLITKVPINSPYDTFRAVACEIFADGAFNWGRIVTLFYFAYKLLLKAIAKVSLVRIIIEWTTRFMMEVVAPWIAQKGGWLKALPCNIMNGNHGAVTLFLSGMLVAYALLWLQRAP